MWQQTKFVLHPYKNIEKIFPLKQRAVEELIEHYENILCRYLRD